MPDSLSPSKATADRPIIWTPNPKQAEFLRAGEDEILYGGAAGGGKSDGILIDALGLTQGATEIRGYQGVLFRRSYPELRDLIDRSLTVYGQTCPGAKYNQTDHIWTWPSGAKLEFGHIHHPSDRFKYRGRQYAYIGWDELTLFPDDTAYVYLSSRLRSPETSLRCYMRATTNPDGPGQAWVKRRWAIPDTGESTRFEVSVKDEEDGKIYVKTRRFIRATLNDNPFLSETDYKITLLNLPPEEREALLRGRWFQMSVRGAYYAEAMGAMRREGRICRVPWAQHVPVDTYWDIGFRDTTAILFHQQVAMQDRFIKGYENSGEALAHYAKVLTDQPYIYGTHYLPHDADTTRMGRDEDSTKSWKSMLEELLPNHRFEVVRRTLDVTVGIEQTRSGVLPGAWMDELECSGLVTALEAYRKKWNEATQSFSDRPLHDWSSHYADAIRQLGQRRGMMSNEVNDTDDDRPGEDSWRTV